MDINLFVKVTSKAWSLAILANLHKGVPGRQATLINATGAGRTAFGQSKDHLIGMELLERNPGHGHPLRAEFRLTAKGKEVAATAYQIMSASQFEDLHLLRRCWTIPILTSLHQPRHFNDIKRDLVTISDRALSQSLKALESRHWVMRHVNQAAHPPRSIYKTINSGEIISNIVGAKFDLPDIKT